MKLVRPLLVYFMTEKMDLEYYQLMISFFWVCNSIFLSLDPKKRLKSGRIFGLGQREIFVFSVPIEMPNLWVQNVFF